MINQRVPPGFSALTIGKYKLLDQLGVGELGRVYLAEHLQMGNRVAVKILAPAKKEEGEAA